MLADKDRIFTNIYGFHDWGLAGRQGARRLGPHQGPDRQGPRLDHQRDQGIGPARPRRRRLPDRPQVVVHAQGRPAAVLSRDQCRRDREPGSCKDREIMRHDPHLLIEGALVASFAMRAHACYIYVRGEFIRERERLQAAIDEAYAAKLIGKDNIHGWDFDMLRAPRRRRLHLRRGDRAARKPRRQEGPAAPEAAVPGQRRPLRCADHGQQRRNHRRRADHPAARRGLVRRPRQAQQHRHQAVPDLRPRRASRAWSRRRWASRCAS